MHRIILVTTLLVFWSFPVLAQPVKTGADILVEQRLDILHGKRIGLITNHTGTLSSGKQLVDELRERGIEVAALLSPEHGIRGEAAAGAKVPTTVDKETGLTVFSLYGKTTKPTPEMLKNIDLLVYHIQDVGVRFYTYISTMFLAMEAAAEHRIPFIVLDRPNPSGGLRCEGPIMEDTLKSYVGMLSVPIVYGLTCGELATMICQNNWLRTDNELDLTVIRMEGWRREMLWDSTGLQWVPPSPNIRTPSTVQVYPATCYLEATNISEGRGTDRAFEMLGAPFVDSERLTTALTVLNLPGVEFFPVSFTPTSSKFAGRLCHGVLMQVSDPHIFRAVETGFHILHSILRLFPRDVRVDTASLKRLVGSEKSVDMLLGGKTPNEIFVEWEVPLHQFCMNSSNIHLY